MVSTFWKSIPGALCPLAMVASLALGVQQAQAGDQKVVVELFTSQGCSSCPPADKFLGKLAGRDDVIALTMPVDYWDYLGWKDTLASPAFSARQRAYAKARGDGQVYTPQMVIDGKYHAVGSHASTVRRVISKSLEKGSAYSVPLDMKVDGDTLIINVGKAQGAHRGKTATIWLALVKQEETVKIARGENRGRTVTYHKVVRNMTPVGHWKGEEVTVRLPKHHLKNKETDGCVVLLQQDKAGPFIAAAEMKRW